MKRLDQRVQSLHAHGRRATHLRVLDTGDAQQRHRRRAGALPCGYRLLHRPLLVIVVLTVAMSTAPVRAADLTREQVIAVTMKPYDGPTTRGVDCSTMTGKVLCGYQGWFAAEGDGLGRGFYHWSDGRGFKPGACKIDLWPDVSELDADERYATPFKLDDGRVAEVFSSYNRK